MFRFIRLLIPVAAWIVCSPPAFAVSPVDILQFQSNVDISREDRITVTEQIVAEVPTSDTNQGIYRDIPVNPRWKDLARLDVVLKVLSVAVDGAACPTDDVEMNYPFLRIYLRDKNRFLSEGAHTFVLTYEMTRQIGYFENRDELTWNVTGSGWTTGVRSASCMVAVPAGASILDAQAWLGQRGEKDSPVSRAEVSSGDRKAIRFMAERAILSGENFTVAVAWPKGVGMPAPSLRPEDETWFTRSLAVLLAIVTGCSTLLWVLFGKDPKTGPAVPVFYPPQLPGRLNRKNEKLSAAAVNYLWNKAKLTPRGLAALFISLVERGDCVVHGDAAEGFEIEKLRVTSAAPEERAAAMKLPHKLLLDETDAEELAAVREACSEQLDKDYRGQWKRNFLYSVLGFIPALSGLFVLFCGYFDTAEEWPEELTTWVGFCVVAFGTGCIFFINLRRMLRRVHVARSLLKLVLCVLFVLGIVWASDWNSLDLSWIFSPFQLMLIVAVPLVPCLFMLIMDAPSLEAAKLRQKIAGLAMYIGTAEAEVLNRLNPPDKPLELYHRLLPYAVALGLEKAWGERFASELESVQDTGDAFLTSYAGIEAFSTSTTETMNSYDSLTEASSSGSSFSDGGGAGSGGGGGGGGAC